MEGWCFCIQWWAWSHHRSTGPAVGKVRWITCGGKQEQTETHEGKLRSIPVSLPPTTWWRWPAEGASALLMELQPLGSDLRVTEGGDALAAEEALILAVAKKVNSEQDASAWYLPLACDSCCFTSVLQISWKLLFWPTLTCNHTGKHVWKCSSSFVNLTHYKTTKRTKWNF